ncbi:MAG: hypothetical protein KBD19_00905 [Candidatus Moranbacteria bacterium]|nr:hypothetical protein [Candidatus Moranbacteria bacterium]
MRHFGSGASRVRRDRIEPSKETAKNPLKQNAAQKQLPAFSFFGKRKPPPQGGGFPEIPTSGDHHKHHFGHLVRGPEYSTEDKRVTKTEKTDLEHEITHTHPLDINGRVWHTFYFLSIP